MEIIAKRDKYRRVVKVKKMYYLIDLQNGIWMDSEYIDTFLKWGYWSPVDESENQDDEWIAELQSVLDEGTMAGPKRG